MQAAWSGPRQHNIAAGAVHIRWGQCFLTRLRLPNDKKVLVSSHRISPAKQQPTKVR